jgi:hypothetical protein
MPGRSEASQGVIRESIPCQDFTVRGRSDKVIPTRPACLTPVTDALLEPMILQSRALLCDPAPRTDVDHDQER